MFRRAVLRTKGIFESLFALLSDFCFTNYGITFHFSKINQTNYIIQFICFNIIIPSIRNPSHRPAGIEIKATLICLEYLRPVTQHHSTLQVHIGESVGEGDPRVFVLLESHNSILEKSSLLFPVKNLASSSLEAITNCPLQNLYCVMRKVLVVPYIARIS